MSAHHVRRCFLCGDAAIHAETRGRVVRTACFACGAVLIIEFDPPDEPALRARIERIDAAYGRMPASDPDKRNARTRHARHSPVALAASRRR
jgi:hypothetical protein